MAERKKIQKVNVKGSVKNNPPRRGVKAGEHSSREITSKPRKKDDLDKTAQTNHITMMPQVNNNIDRQNKSQKSSLPKSHRREFSAKSEASTAGRPRQNKQTAKRKSSVTRPIDFGTNFEKSLTVILGKKTETRRKRLITSLIAFVIITTIIIFCSTSPTGPIERITNSFTVMGGGKFPVSISGNDVLTLKTENDKSFLLTDSHLCGYNSSGKEFVNYQHNFSNPVLKTSVARTLVYNRESTGFIIANHTNVLFEQNLDNAIFCGDISYNGSVAFVTDSQSYAAQILVFNKGMKQYFSWYLADGLVSDITLSNDGDKLAVAVLKVKNGEFCTVIYCLDTDKDQPVFEKELLGESIAKLETVSSKKFAYISNKGSAFIDWKSGAVTDDSPKVGAPSFMNTLNNGLLVTYGETANSQIVFYKPSGLKRFQLEYNGLIDCITSNDKYVYILSGNQIYVLNSEGEQVNLISLNQKPKFISGIKGGVLAVDNLTITKHQSTTEK